jgi:hypothetical protein
MFVMLRYKTGLQTLHSISSHQLDLLRSMDKYMESTVLPILKDVNLCWQPTDFLPDSSSPDFADQASLHACISLHHNLGRSISASPP